MLSPKGVIFPSNMDAFMKSASWSRVVMVRMLRTRNVSAGACSDISVEDATYRMEPEESDPP